MVGLMVFGGLLAVAAPADERSASGRETVNYVSLSNYNISTVAPGDKIHRPGYTVQNICTIVPYTLWNVTLRVEGVKDAPDPFIWLQEDCREKNNISRLNSYLYSGIEFEVAETVAVGKYNVTFLTTFDFYVQGEPTYRHYQEMDIVVIEVRSILTPPATISHYYDSSALPPSAKSTLYAGERFQKTGFSAPTSSVFSGSGRAVVGNRVQATLVDRSGVDYNGLTWSGRVATINDVTRWSYFMYRLTIDQSKPAGRYEYTLQFEYARKDALTLNERIVIRETTVISLMVDFTPVLEISSGAEYTIAQGTSQFSVSMVLRNSGNCDLARLNVWLDVSGPLQLHGGYYFDGDGEKTPAGAKISIEALPKGNQQTVSFLVDAFRYLPAGEHRLPLRYTGYCYDDGSYTYSDWKATSDADYQIIKGGELYVKVVITDPSVDVSAAVTATFSLARQTLDLSVPVTITNKEAVGYGDVTLGLACFPRTSPAATIFVNPLDPASKTLDEIHLLSLPASSTAPVAFRGDLSPKARPGTFEVELDFSATDLNTGLPVSKTLVVNIRVTPGPPVMGITTSYEQAFVRPGKEFLLEVRLDNNGQDTAYDVSVAMLIPNGRSSGFIVSGDRADAYAIEGMLNPFSVGTSRISAGDIKAGTGFEKNFTIAADRNMARSRAYPMTVEVTYKDAEGVSHKSSTDISVMATGSPPAKAAAPDPVAGQFALGASLIVLIWVLFLAGALVVMKAGGRWASRAPRGSPAPAPLPQPAQQLYLPAPATPMQAQPQYTPPPSAAAQPQYTLPPAPEATQAQPPQPAEGARPCPKCGATAPAGLYACPNCGGQF